MTEFKIFRVFVVMILGVTLAAGTAWATTSSSTQGDYPERTPERSAPANSRSLQSSAITPTATALDVAYAIAPDNSQISEASFIAKPPAGSPAAVSDTPLAGFPRNGSGYGILATGDATSASLPNDSGSTSGSNEGGNVRGDTDYDVTILKVDLNVPQEANCLSLDFKFLSEEFEEFIGSSFNDAFIAELDNSTWSTSGSNVSAPNNFASASGNGASITINNVGFTASSASAANGTTYDGATDILRASTPVTPGAHSLFLSIFDQGDHSYDSAVFVDKLTAYAADAGGCGMGVEATDPVAKYAPAVYLADLENTWPMSASKFIGESRLMWSHGAACGNHDEADTGDVLPESLSLTSSGPYYHWPIQRKLKCKHNKKQELHAGDYTRPRTDDRSPKLGNKEGFYLDLDNDFHKGTPPADEPDTTPGTIDVYDQAPVYYQATSGVSGNETPDVPEDDLGSHEVITYWFFYGYSSAIGGHVAAHEGDWEHVNVHLSTDGERATQVDYFAHHFDAEPVLYEDTEKIGTHPVVYSALNSHASYPNTASPPFWENPVSKGSLWRTWDKSPVNVKNESWYGYGGAWGRVGTTSNTTGPLGPSEYKDPLGSG